MAKEHKIADKLSYKELYKIQDYLIEMSDSSVTLFDVWSDIGKILQQQREDGLTKKEFIDSLSVNIKMHRLGGYKIQEDKLVLENLELAKSTLKNLKNPPDKQMAIDSEDNEYKWNSFNKPLTTIGRTKKLWINDTCYKVPMAPDTLVYFLEHILLAKKDPEGIVLFEGQRWTCDSAMLHRYISAFLGISSEIEVPNENTCDENGIPLWLSEEK